MVKRFVRFLIKLVLYVIFVAVAIVYTPKVLSKLLHTPYPLATVTSASMWPALKTNDLILVKGAKGSDVQVGQIIIFGNGTGFTIHRLIRKDKGKLVTKGDANNVEDTPIDPSLVIGTVVHIKNKIFRIPYLGSIARNFGPQLQKIRSQ